MTEICERVRCFVADAYTCDRVLVLTCLYTRHEWECERARAHERVCLVARASAPNLASTFRRCGPRAVGLSGVLLGLLGVHVQREHRRVEHRVGVKHGLRMRRFRPAARHVPDALGRSSMRRGPLCAAPPPMRTNACAHTRTGTRLRGRPRLYV